MPAYPLSLVLLRSDDCNRRYEACDQSRVRPPLLPQEALDALPSATNDSGPDVVDAAERGLALHNLNRF
jgi:hypothetical protein